METIGLASVLEDKAFQDGLKRYQDGVSRMESVTDRGASIMSKAWAASSAAVAIGAGTVIAGIGGWIAVSKKGLDELQKWNDQVNTLSDVLGTSGKQSSAWAVAMNRVGVSVEEGGAGLNFFIKNLNELKNVSTGVQTVTAKNADAIENLRRRLDDANVRLERAKLRLAEAKEPTREMQYAVTDAEKAVSRLNQELGAATQLVPKAAANLSPFQKALKELGIEAFDAQGKLRSFDDIMPDLLDAFEKMPNGVRKSALAMELFGARAGTKFLDFLSQGAKGLERARRLAQLYGLELSTDLSDATEEFGFELNTMNLGLRGFWVTIGKEALPVATRFVQFINDRILPSLISWAKDVMPPLFQRVREFTDWIEDKGIPSLTEWARVTLAPLLKNLQELWAWIGTTGLGRLEQFFRGVDRILALFRGSGEPVRILADAVNYFAQSLGLSKDTADTFSTAILGLEGPIQHLWDAIQKRDWAQVATIIGSGLRAGGEKIWDWITTTALPKLEIEGAKLIAGAQAWVERNGPRAWVQLQAWGADFWTWLTGPGGALSQVAERVFPLMSSISSWLQTNWDTQVAPALESWRAQFWEWLTDPQTGAIVRSGDNLVLLTSALRQATEDPQVKAGFENVGRNIGSGIINAIADLFTGADGKTQTDNALSKLVRSLIQSNLDQTLAYHNIGVSIVNGILEGMGAEFKARRLDLLIYDSLNSAADSLFGQLNTIAEKIVRALRGGLAEEFNKGLLDPLFADWLNKSADALIGHLNEVAAKIVAAINDALTKFVITLPSIQLPTFGTPPPAPAVPGPSSIPPPQSGVLPFGNSGTAGGTGSSAASVMQAIPLSLQVMIDGMEIRNAVVTWVSTEVQSQFGEAGASAPI